MLSKPVDDCSVELTFFGVHTQGDDVPAGTGILCGRIVLGSGPGSALQRLPEGESHGRLPS